MAKKTRNKINEALPPDWDKMLKLKALFPTPGKELGSSLEGGAELSAQYHSEEKKRERLRRALQVWNKEVEAGRADSHDSRQKFFFLANLLQKYQDEDQREEEKRRALQNLRAPPSPPEPSPEEVQAAVSAGSPTAAQRAAVSDAEAEAEEAARRQRGEEKATVDVENQRLKDLSDKGHTLLDLRRKLQRGDLPKEERRAIAAQIADLEAELADYPQFLDIDVGLPGRPRSKKITYDYDYEIDPKTGQRWRRDPKTGKRWKVDVARQQTEPAVKGTDVVKFEPSDIDDAELRRAGMSPGWTTVATLASDSKGGPLFGNYKVLDPTTRKLVPGSKDISSGLSNLKDSKHGAMRMLRALKANPNYTVRIYKSGASKGAKSSLHGSAWFNTGKKTAAGETIFTHLGSGTPEEAQKIAEEAAAAAGVKGIESAPGKEAPRGSEMYDVPSAPLTSPGDPDYTPPGGWIEAPEEMNDVEFADEDEINPEHPIAWGDFWEKLSPAEIDALHVNPIEIDKHVISNPRLTQAQKNAIQRKLNIAKKMTGRGEAGSRFERDLSPAERFASHKGFARGLVGDDKVEPVVDSKGKKVIDPKTGRPKMKITFGWERPVHSGAIPPSLQKNRAAIQLMVPYLRNYLELLQGWATAAIKPISKDTQFLHQQFNTETGEEIPVEDEFSEEDVESDAPCGKCGHPASVHAGWPNQALECEHPDCLYTKPTKAGNMQYNRCEHYVATKTKSKYKPKKFKHGALNFRVVDDIAKQLATIPSRWGSKAGGRLEKGFNVPPYSPAEIKSAMKEALAIDDAGQRSAALQKVRQMNDKVAKWYEEMSKKAQSGVTHEEKPPHSKKDVLEARKNNPELFAQMNAENHRWKQEQENRAEDKKTLVSQLGVLKNWLAAARDNMKKSMRDSMNDKWRHDVFGESLDDETDRFQKSFIDKMVHGQTQGISRATGQGKQQAFSGAAETAGVPEHLLSDPDAVNQGIDRLEKNIEVIQKHIASGQGNVADKKTLANMLKAYETLISFDPNSQKRRRLSNRVADLKNRKELGIGMSKWDENELKGYEMIEAAWGPDVDWSQMQKMFAGMAKEQEQEQKETNSWLLLGDSILGFINRNVGILSLSGGRGRSADDTAWELQGRGIGFAGDVPAGSGVQSKPPTIRTKAEIEAEQGASAAAEAEKAAKRRQDAIDLAKSRGGEFKGSPKTRPTSKDAPFDIPVERVPGKLSHVTGPKPEEAFPDPDISSVVTPDDETRAQKIDDEISQIIGASASAEDVEDIEKPEEELGTNYGEFQGLDIPGKKITEKFDRYLIEIAESSTADRKPNWYDDL